MWGHDHMWGMHWGWWIFWILMILFAVWVLTQRRPSASPPQAHESPLDILQRRYASGEISTEEYEERKARLKADRR